MTSVTVAPDLLHLLQTAVCAKFNYWDANCALEIALAGENITDQAATEVERAVSLLAAGIDHPSGAFTHVTLVYAQMLAGEIDLIEKGFK